MTLYPHFLTARNELEGLRALLECILTSGKRNGVYLEVVGCLLSMDFCQNRWNKFCDLREAYLEAGGDISRLGWDRATRVYTNRTDRPTKPSYLKRLVAYPDKPRNWKKPMEGLDQVEKIGAELARKPGFSNLSFVILRPADLHDQFRPGYVPCAIAGDFKFRKGRLDLNIMFRTSDALAVGYADIYYMRNLQLDVLTLAKTKTKNAGLKKGQLGVLNMYLCRTYIQQTWMSKSGVRMDGLRATHAVVKLLKATETAGKCAVRGGNL